jgi:hypothetical protein
MSEQEFDRYLKRLCRGLGLTSRQRGQISDELRDHLEERLAELASCGVPRDQAVLQALDEFGDASVLAGRFTTIARLKQRRFYVHLSLSAVALLAVALFAGFGFRAEIHAITTPPSQDLTESKPLPKPATKTPAEAPKTVLLPREKTPLERSVKASRKIPVESRVADEHPLSSGIGQNPKT